MGKAETKFANTAKRMDDALLALLDAKPYAEITITDVCREADVYRSTFYAHYANMAELLEEVKDHVLQGFFARFYGLPTEGGYLTREYLDAYLGFIEENQHIFSVFLGNLSTLDGWDIFESFVVPYVASGDSDGKVPSASMRYRLIYITTGITAIVSAWIAGDFKERREEMVEIILGCVGETV